MEFEIQYSVEGLNEKANNAMSFTEEVTTRWNDRLVGSPDCLECGNYLLECFKEEYDTTRMHSFTVRPSAFLGVIDFGVVFFFLTVIALWIQSLNLAVILAIIPILITIFQFFFYKDFISFLYPQKTGQNILGFIEPTDEVKQQVIISAHHDSAHIFNLLEKDPKNFDRIVSTANLISFSIAFVVLGLWIAQLLGFQSSMVIYVVAGLYSLMSYWVTKLWYFYDKKGTPGAGDNMICTAIAMEVGKYFSVLKKAGNGLKHTRVVVASWDAEEAGLRGARAYVKKYLSELKAIKTYNFNLECMYDAKAMAFLTSDLNGFVPLSESMVDECVTIGKSRGYDVARVAFPLMAGGTDAAEFAKVGIEATTLAAMNWVTKQVKNGQPAAYHTRRDTIEAVDEKAVAISIDLGIAYILRKERDLSSS